MSLRRKFNPGVGTREVLLVAVDRFAVVTEEVDSGCAFFQRDGGGPGTGLGIPFHICPLVSRDWLVQERSGTFRSAVVDPPDATADRLRAFVEAYTNSQLVFVDLMA